MNIEALRAWAQEALDDYYADAYAGEPEYPQMADDVLALIREHRALLAHNDMLVARLRMAKGECND